MTDKSELPDTTDDCEESTNTGTSDKTMLLSNMTLVLGDWLGNVFLPMSKMCIVTMCVVNPMICGEAENAKQQHDYELQFEAMGGEIIASGGFRQTSTSQELYSFVRQQLESQARRDGSSYVPTLFTLCYGTYEVPNRRDDVILNDFLKPAGFSRTLTVVFMPTPNYDQFTRLKSIDYSGHEFADLAFSPDGRTLATVAYEHDLKLWSIENQQLQLVKTFSNNDHLQFSTVDFSIKKKSPK